MGRGGNYAWAQPSMSAQQYQREYGQKDPKRQQQGRENRALGAAFEQYIANACEHYAQKGDAVVEKTPEPMRVVSGANQHGKFTACFEEKAQPDFKGVLRGGRAVAFEAKYTSQDRIQQGAVTDRQATQLEKYARCGAECFIIVAFNMREFFRVPWQVWRSMKEFFGRKYLKPEELTRYRIPLASDGTLLFLDKED